MCTQTRSRTATACPGTSDGHAQFQWIRVDDNDEETPIPDATSVFYVPTGDDIGNRIKVRARFRDFGENQESLDSDLTDTVRTWNREARGYLTISGTGQVGETLHVSTAHVSDPDGLDNATFRYEWIFTFRRGEHPNRSIHTSEASYTSHPRTAVPTSWSMQPSPTTAAILRFKGSAAGTGP